MIKKCALFIVTLAFSGCTASSKLTMVADRNSDVYLLELRNIDAAGTSLGETPVTVDFDQVLGKAIRLERSDADPQFWFFVPPDGNSTTIQTRLPTKPVVKIKKNQGLAPNINVPFRLVMLAYHSLSQSRYEEAVKYAQQLQDINSDIAAPHIIRGLVYLQQGQNADAKKSFELAKSIDSADQMIDSLISASGQ